MEDSVPQLTYSLEVGDKLLNELIEVLLFQFIGHYELFAESVEIDSSP